MLIGAVREEAYMETWVRSPSTILPHAFSIMHRVHGDKLTLWSKSGSFVARYLGYVGIGQKYRMFQSDRIIHTYKLWTNVYDS